VESVELEFQSAPKARALARNIPPLFPFPTQEINKVNTQEYVAASREKRKKRKALKAAGYKWGECIGYGWGWFDPDTDCTCGADAHNAKLDAIIAGLRKEPKGERLEWTREKPKAQGWYWLREDRNPEYWCPVFVRVIGEDLGPAVFIEESPEEELKDIDVDGINASWAGPIPEPSKEAK
jgi:hypothetical protein